VGNITYADTPGDWGLQQFSTAHDDAHTLPVLRRARELNPDLKIVASPWTAPLWLKTGEQRAPQIGEGSLLDSPQAYETYANYFVKFVQDYQRKGVFVNYLTLQNEPSHGGCGTMPCMLLPEWQAATLAIKVGQKLKTAGLAETKVSLVPLVEPPYRLCAVPKTSQALPSDPRLRSQLGQTSWRGGLRAGVPYGPAAERLRQSLDQRDRVALLRWERGRADARARPRPEQGGAHDGVLRR
jgi:hypothetical protein